MTTTPNEIARQHLATQTAEQLVDMAKIAEAKRDVSLDGDGFMDYAAVLGMVWDELDRRFPSVLTEWDDLAAEGIEVDLTAMYAVQARWHDEATR